MGAEDPGFSPERRSFLKLSLGFAAFAATFINSLSEALASIVNPKLSEDVRQFTERTLSYLKEYQLNFVKSLSDGQRNAFCKAVAEVAAGMLTKETDLYKGFAGNPDAFGQKCQEVFARVCLREGVPLDNSQLTQSRDVFKGLATHLATTNL